MGGDRGKEIIRLLGENDLDRLLSGADDPKVVRRLTFVKNLYAGATLEEATSRVGKFESTGSRWARPWNGGGLGQLTPNFGDGRTPNLGEGDRKSWLRCSVRVSPGNHRKFTISSTKNSALHV